jgi:hypothetical protein
MSHQQHRFRGFTMKRIAWVVFAVSVIVALFLGIRIYGAFQTEKDAAIARADKADQEAQALDAKSKEDSQRVDCSNQWLEYKNKLLEKQIAELRGGFGRTPVEPSCEGYAMSLTQGMDVGMEGMQALLAASDARQYASYEREYSTNRKLQARFLGIRAWAFLKGTELKPLQQATMQMDEDAKVRKPIQTATRP